MPELVVPADIECAAPELMNSIVVCNPYMFQTTATVPTFISCSSGTAIIVPNSIYGGYITTSSTSSTTNTISVSGTYFTNGTGVIYSNAPANWATYGNFAQHKPKRGPLIRKSIRSSIKRAMKLIDNFGMSDDIKVFLSGQDIEVSHPESLFKFVLQKGRHGLLYRTEYPGSSTPYQLSLYTKTDVHVADLCVYMDKTPILDQVLALSMFIKTGNEDTILDKANFRNLCGDKDLRTTLALGSPTLQKKLRVKDIDITGVVGSFVTAGNLDNLITVNGSIN